MSTIDEIRKRLTEDQSAQPTREEADYLLSLVKDGGAALTAREKWLLHDASSVGRSTIQAEQYAELRRLARRLSATAPTETSARCGERKCLKCGHNHVVNGECWHVHLDKSLCGCKCVFPASTEQAGEQKVPKILRDGARCPECGRALTSDFDPDVGLWYECKNCDLQFPVSSAPATPVAQPRRLYRTRYCDHCQMDHNYFIGWSDDDKMSNLQSEQHSVSQTLSEVDSGSNAAAKAQVDPASPSATKAGMDRERESVVMGVAQPEADPVNYTSDVEHVWIDGPDGPKYHCAICGISKRDNHACWHTCRSWLREKAKRAANWNFEGEHERWLSYLASTTTPTTTAVEADWCDVCQAPQMVLPDGSHVCGNRQDRINAAATKICDYCGIDQNDSERVAAIISRYFPQPRIYHCSCGAVCTAEEYIEHALAKGHDRGLPAQQPEVEEDR